MVKSKSSFDVINQTLQEDMLRRIAHEKIKNRSLVKTGRHAGKIYSRLPSAYLRYMKRRYGDKSVEYYIADILLSNRHMTDTSSDIIVSNHAVDKFSMMFLHKWATADQELGLASFIANEANTALKLAGGKNIDNKYTLDGVTYVIAIDDNKKTVITVYG